LLALLLFVRFLLPVLVPGTAMYGIMGGLAGGLLIAIWWLFFSRASGTERWGAPFLMVFAIGVTTFFVHESIATGAMGLLPALLAVPLLSVTFVGWSLGAGKLAKAARVPVLVGLVTVSCAALTLIRTDGMIGKDGPVFAWRWTATAE
jgi:hypothetical protein